MFSLDLYLPLQLGSNSFLAVFFFPTAPMEMISKPF